MSHRWNKKRTGISAKIFETTRQNIDVRGQYLEQKVEIRPKLLQTVADVLALNFGHFNEFPNTLKYTAILVPGYELLVFNCNELYSLMELNITVGSDFTAKQNG